MINTLPETNPILYRAYEDSMHGADATGKFLRESGRCALTAVGDINTYSIFAELTSSLVNKKGRTGIIVPTGIATDDSNKVFFGSMIENNRLVSLFDFENKEAIFQSVHRSYKFCLLTLSGSDIGNRKASFGFFLSRVEHMQDPLRVFSLSKDDLLRLNPNTKTCPVFRTSIDAELTSKIYKKIPILINEDPYVNSWGIKFSTMFHMSNDSYHFRMKDQLETDDFKSWGNKMKNGNVVWLPLYEAKMIWHYDHRFGSYEGIENRISTQTPTPTLEQYQNPAFQITPWYWVEQNKVKEQLIKRDSEGNVLWELTYKWLLGFRDITNSTNERTAILSIEPLNAVGNNNPLLFHEKGAVGSVLLQGNFSSLVFDFPTRFKIAGTHMNFFYVNQLPVLKHEDFDKKSQLLIISKSIELIFTSWDIKPFTDDVWKEADADLKSAITKQWEENKEVTGGHEWKPPEWCEIDKTGCPLPPFKWDESRRAFLKAALDAIYAKLYGLITEELRYILDPQDVYGPDFPGETFRVLKEKEIRLYGEYRTRRLVLDAWEKLNNS